MRAKGGLTQIKRLDSKLPYATDLIAAFGFETETEELIKLGLKMPCDDETRRNNCGPKFFQHQNIFSTKLSVWTKK